MNSRSEHVLISDHHPNNGVQEENFEKNNGVTTLSYLYL